MMQLVKRRQIEAVSLGRSTELLGGFWKFCFLERWIPFDVDCTCTCKFFLVLYHNYLQ